MRRRYLLSEESTESSFDLSISDLMAALLLIMILVLSATLLNLQREFEKKSNIAERYYNLQISLYEDLFEEFREDLEKWNATIDKETLSVRFKEPDVQFDPNRAYLKYEFKTILDDFFPRYIEILNSDKYRKNIEEIRIEGHTANKNNKYPYMNGIVLSQERTNNVLGYILSLNYFSENQKIKKWLQEKITANGLSSSRPILNADGTPNWILSRRVEFRVRTNAEEQIREMLQIGEYDFNEK